MPIWPHLQTVWPLIQSRLSPPKGPPLSIPWRQAVDEGRSVLSGFLTVAASGVGGGRLLIFVHGLGGSADSTYMMHLAAAAFGQGVSCLRLNLRGADRRGNDICHAGLTSDFGEILESDSLRAFESIAFAGFSLGGHLCLKFGTEVSDPRVRAIAAVCSPLDLDVTVRDIDRPSRALYRRYVLASLNEIYARVLVDHPGAAPLEEVRRIRTIRGWDRAVVVPRFGFESAEDYYSRASVAGKLDRLRVPTLLVATEGDPMVSARSIRLGLRGTEDSLDVRWSQSGGHGSLPRDLDLGLEAPRGVYGQVVGWLLNHP